MKSISSSLASRRSRTELGGRDPLVGHSVSRDSLITRWLPLAVIAAAWAASLALPGFTAGGRTYAGYEVLVRGWEGVSRGIYAWLANPLFIAAFVAALVKQHRAAAVLAACALVIGATTFLTEDLLRQRMSGVPPITLGSGFYLWLGAILALCGDALIRVLRQRRRRDAERSQG